MRHLCVAAVIALSVLIPLGAPAQTPVLSISNYQLVSEQRVTRTVSDLAYRADLLNNGPARAAVTATVTSKVASVQVMQGSLHFANVPANGRVASSDTFTIRVDRSVPFDFAGLQWTFPSGAAPIANAGPNQTAPVGATVTLNGSGSSNPGGAGTLTYSWAFAFRPAGSTAVLNNPASVMPTFVIDKAGTYAVTLTVSNGLASDSASVTVSTVNSPPVANAGPNQSVPVGAMVTLNGAGSSDVDGNPLTYAWTLTQRPAGSAAVLTGANSVGPAFVADKAGTYVATLVVNDGTSGSAPATVAITTLNTPPVANAGASQTVTPRSVVRLNGSASTDVDGDPLTYHWNLIAVPVGSTAILSSTTAVNPAFTADKSGTYVAQLIVSDGRVSSAPATVTITTQNTPPVANAGSTQTVNVGTVVQLNGSASTDVDGDPLTYQWSLITVPVGSTAALSSTAVNPAFTADRAGSYIAQLIVNDGKVNSAPATVTITTNALQPPAAGAGLNQTVKHGSLVTLNGSGTDPQGRSLTFQWSLLTKPAGSAASLSATTIAQPTFLADLPGNYVAQLIVNNGFLNSAPSTVTITTTNTAPVANAGPDQNATAGSVVALNGSSSPDADGDPLTYAWSLTTRPPGSNAAVSAANSATPTFFADVAGTYVAQLIVSDPFTGSAPDTVTITVQNRGTILLSGTAAVALRQSIAFPVSLSAPAAPGGLTVTLTVTDSSKLELSASTVFVSEGETEPAAQPVITGLSPGTVQIGATGQGYASAGQPVQITATITFTPAVLTINGNGTTKNLNLTLSAPAPAGGLPVTVSSGNTGVAAAPEIVIIPQNATTVAVPVTSVSPGSAVIRASASNVPETSAEVTVNRVDILLPENVIVPPGDSLIFPVALARPAQSPTFIALASSDESKVKVSLPNIFINPGQTQPAAPPRVIGVAGGAATITATAIGLNTAQTTVQAGFAVTFTPPSAIVSSTGTTNLPLRLSGPAPQSGLTLALTSSNTSVATVPPSVIFGATTTQAIVPVTGVAPGTAVIRASAANIGEATATVTVEGDVTIILPNSTTVISGQSIAFPLSLSTPAPAGGVSIALASSDTAKVEISPSAVTIPAGQTQPAAQPVVTGVSPGVAEIRASAPGYASVSRPVQVNAAPAQITATSGTPQSTRVGTSFAAPFVVVVKDAAGNPVSGIIVTFTAPSPGPGGAFAGGLNTATTNGAGLAAAPVFTANQLDGSYVVTASVAGIAAPATFALTNTPAIVPGTIAIIPASVGQNLQAPVTITLPQPAPAGGLRVTVISGDPASMLVAGRAADAGSPQISITIGEGLTTVSGVYVHGLTSSGTVSLTATAANGISGTAAITLTRSGFVLAGPNGTGSGSFTTTAGSSTQLTLSAARLDSSLNYVETQQVRGGSSYTTDIAGSFSSVGDVSPAQITIGGGQASAVFTFTALATGHTTLTASVPAGFSQPSGAANTLAVNIVSSTLVVPSVTVGRNLQVPATIRMTSPAPGGGISVTVASSSADKVLFSPTADGAGSESITLAIAGGRTSTAEFYVQALGNSGSVTYTATAPGLGAMAGTVSLAPSGFVLYGPFGLGADFFTTPGAGLSGLTVYPALLDSTMNVVELQQIRGGLSVDVDIASSNPMVGTIAASPVRFTGGAAYADTQFQPAISGTTVLSINTPAGYSVPSRHSSLTATVRAPGIGVEDGVVIGKNLQTPGMVLLGEPAPSSGLSLTLTSNSGQLLLSASPTTAGSASITINIAAGQSSAPFVMQAFAESGTATYTVTAPGYGSRSATVSFAPSGIVIAGPLGPGFPLSTPVSAASQEVTISTALLDPDTGSYVMSQPLAGGTDLAVSLTSTDSAVASIQSTVTIRGGTDSVVMPFTLLSAGSVTLSVETPAGFTTPRHFTNLVVLATE